MKENQSPTMPVQYPEQGTGVQVIHMDVDSTGYKPSIFTVRAGEPVQWEIDGKTSFGCQTTLVAPQIGVEKNISLGKNLITFVPNQEGDINFSCSMNMFKGVIHVVKS